MYIIDRTSAIWARHLLNKTWITNCVTSLTGSEFELHTRESVLVQKLVRSELQKRGSHSRLPQIRSRLNTDMWATSQLLLLLFVCLWFRAILWISTIICGCLPVSSKGELFMTELVLLFLKGFFWSTQSTLKTGHTQITWKKNPILESIHESSRLS